MVPKLVRILEEALEEARGVRQSMERGDRSRHASITVTHLEDALLRARLMFGIGEPV